MSIVDNFGDIAARLNEIEGKPRPAPLTAQDRAWVFGEPPPRWVNPPQVATCEDLMEAQQYMVAKQQRLAASGCGGGGGGAIGGLGGGGLLGAQGPRPQWELAARRARPVAAVGAD